MRTKLGTPVLGSPLFKKAELHLENGANIIIYAANNNKANRYISSMKIDGHEYTKNYLSHKELINGCRIDIEMCEEANKKRGIKPQDCPYSFSLENN